MAAERSMRKISAVNIDSTMIIILTSFKFGVSSTNPPKRQIKTLSKVSHYAVCTYVCMYICTYVFNMPQIISGENTEGDGLADKATTRAAW